MWDLETVPTLPGSRPRTRVQQPVAFASRLAAFRQGLTETGYVEGRNVAIEFRWAEIQHNRRPWLRIVAPGGAPAALAAQSATTTIPIVFEMGADPIAVSFETSSQNARVMTLRLAATAIVEPDKPQARFRPKLRLEETPLRKQFVISASSALIITSGLALAQHEHPSSMSKSSAPSGTLGQRELDAVLEEDPFRVVKRKCAGCGGDIPNWRNGRRVSSSTGFCNPVCQRKTPNAGLASGDQNPVLDVQTVKKCPPNGLSREAV